MRVVIVGGPYYSVPPTKYGGTERVIFYLIKGLKELGHEPILLAPGDSRVDCELIPIVDKALHFPKKDSPAFRRHVATALKTTDKILHKLASSVDIIHSHDFDMSPYQDCPHVTTIHGHIGFEQLGYYHARKNVPYVTISKNQQQACTHLNYVGVAYNGEDPADFPIVTKPQKYVCFIGRFDLDKSPHLALQLALNSGIKIKMAGKIDLGGYDYFKKEIKPYLNHQLVEFWGEVDSVKREELISKASCNIHPLMGRREPFGLTVIEAAYCGTPTMAMNRSSMPELIKHGRTGYLVEDFIEGSHHLEEVFSLDRKRVARHARQTFNYRNMTKQYLQAYRKVMKEFKQNG